MIILVIILLASNAGLVGLSLTYVISLNGLFQYCVRVSAEVESLVSEVVFNHHFSVLIDGIS